MGSNICRVGGIPMDKKICPCFKCVARRNNAKNRAGSDRAAKRINVHGDGTPNHNRSGGRRGKRRGS